MGDLGDQLGWDADVIQAFVDRLEVTYARTREIQDAVRAGELPHDEGLIEITDLRDDAATELQELVGAADLALFHERVGMRSVSPFGPPVEGVRVPVEARGAVEP